MLLLGEMQFTQPVLMMRTQASKNSGSLTEKGHVGVTQVGVGVLRWVGKQSEAIKRLTNPLKRCQLSMYY